MSRSDFKIIERIQCIYIQSDICNIGIYSNFIYVYKSLTSNFIQKRIMKLRYMSNALYMKKIKLTTNVNTNFVLTLH